MTFHFDLKKVEALLEDAYGAKKHRSLASAKGNGKPGLFLVHDSGVYLMSTAVGSEIDPVYAKGHGPSTHMGGDDFGEFIDLDVRGFSIEEDDDLIISLSDTEIRISIEQTV